MIQPVNSGRRLLEEIDRAECARPALWWLGHSGFAVKYHNLVFYVDPYLTDSAETRLMASPLAGHEIANADLVLCTHAHQTHMDSGALPAVLAASPRARLVLPKSSAEHARAMGIDYARMSTTDADLRIEYFKDGVYGRVYAVPSAHDQLDWTPLGGYPYLGYLIRFGNCTIYHAGDCVPYEGLAERLRRYNVTIALLPISGHGGNGAGTFHIAEAAQLAEDIGARWLVPMHYGMFSSSAVDVNRFIEHMLGHRPAQRFKIFQCGEGWALPRE